MEHNTKITTMSALGFADMLRSVNLLNNDSKASFIFTASEDIYLPKEKPFNIVEKMTSSEFGQKIKSLMTTEQMLASKSELIAVITKENLQINSDCGINVTNQSSSKKMKFN